MTIRGMSLFLVAVIFLVSVQSFSHVAVVPGSGTETRNHFLSFVHRSAQSSDEEVYKGAGDNDMMSSSQPSRRHLKSLFSVFATASVLASSYLAPLPAMAAESQVIGQIQGSGLFFKDTLEVERFEDPKIKGITLYITNFQRPITERLTTNFLQDPSYASVACAKTSPTVAIADNINTSPQGEEVFEESKSILFKTLRVQRIYDTDKKTAVYVSFNTRLDKSDDTNKSRFKSSVCAVSLE